MQIKRPKQHAMRTKLHWDSKYDANQWNAFNRGKLLPTGSDRRKAGRCRPAFLAFLLLCGIKTEEAT